ncbi:O-antigen ligase family protein [Cupriavidus sp. DL-D2]|uniref:O-antigen ligase family protein n=1 Tax=Cupriavidus sp. DL-D2 TaxID=3144974 RepID=UPI0032142958
MNFSKSGLTTLADVLVFAFPILVLCVPRGAGLFLAGIAILMLAGRRGMGRAWREYSDFLVPLAVSVVLFVAVFIFSKVYHDTPWNVIDNPSRALLAILACWVIARTSPDPVHLWRGITIALAGAFLIVVYQKFVMGVPRPSAWIQAIAFANMVAALTLVGFARPGTSRGEHAEAWLNVLLGTSILMLNGTRGALVAMLVAIVPMLMVRYRRLNFRTFVLALCGAAVLGAGAYLVPDSPVSARVDDAVREIQQYQHGQIETSVGVRLKIWHLGMQYFAEHPWSGVGVGQFARILHASTFCQETQSTACVLEHAHNDIVETASTTGIPGLIVFLGLFLVPAVLFARVMRACRSNVCPKGVSLGGGGLGVVLSALICGLTQVTLAHQANVVFYAGLTGLLLGMAARESRVAQRHTLAPVSSSSMTSNVVRMTAVTGT